MPAVAGLKRSGTHQGHHKQANASQTRHTPSPPEHEEEDDVGDDYYEEYYPPAQPQPQPIQGPGQYVSSRGSSSPWNANNQLGEWRPASGADNSAINEALSNLEIGSNASSMYRNLTEFQPGQSIHPPRFNPNQPPPTQAPGLRNNNNNNKYHNTGNDSSAELRLETEFNGRKTPLASGHPVSAGPYVPPIGHGPQQPHHHPPQRSMTGDERSSGAVAWDQQKDKVIVPRTSNSNLQYLLQQQAKSGIIPNVPSIPRQYLLQQQQQIASGLASTTPQGQGQNQGFANSPIDVPSLIATKGYNPINFDVRPQFVSLFLSQWT
jgi:hypothetical protein